VLTAAATTWLVVAGLWSLVEAAPLAVAALGLATGALAAWTRRLRPGGRDAVAAPALALAGVALNVAVLAVAASHGK